MRSYGADRLPPVHPGEVLQTLLDDMGMTANALALALLLARNFDTSAAATAKPSSFPAGRAFVGTESQSLARRLLYWGGQGSIR